MDKKMKKVREISGRYQDILRAYMQERISIIGIFFLFVCIFFVVFRLYHLPAKITIYPTLICLVLGLLYSVKDFYMYRKAHIQRTNLSKNIEITLDNLPQPLSLLEEDYQVY